VHHAAFARDAVQGELTQTGAHGVEFFRRVAVAGEFLPRLFAGVALRAFGLGGFVLRQSDVTRSQHGEILADGGTQGESAQGEPPGQCLGRPVEINVLFEPVQG
jgi:hypothetical protein